MKVVIFYGEKGMIVPLKVTNEKILNKKYIDVKLKRLGKSICGEYDLKLNSYKIIDSDENLNDVEELTKNKFWNSLV